MAASNSAKTTPAEKLCLACKEPIPAGATVCFHCRARQAPERESESKRLFAWIGVVTTVIGLSKAKGYRAADVVAHLRWLNLLKKRG